MNAKKQARRERAAKRFKVLNLIAWAKARGLGGHIDNLRADYHAYVERKGVEASALGL